MAVILKVINNIHPDRPKDEACHGNPLSDEMWELMLRCWDPDPQSRPQVAEVIHTLHRIARLHVPSALFIRGVYTTGKTSPILDGSFYDIVQGTYEGHDVTIRRLRIPPGTSSGKRFHQVSVSSWQMPPTYQRVASTSIMKLWYGDDCGIQEFCPSLGLILTRSRLMVPWA
jgi:hypothetical protein